MANRDSIANIRADGQKQNAFAIQRGAVGRNTVKLIVPRGAGFTGSALSRHLTADLVATYRADVFAEQGFYRSLLRALSRQMREIEIGRRWPSLTFPSVLKVEQARMERDARSRIDRKEVA